MLVDGLVHRPVEVHDSLAAAQVEPLGNDSTTSSA
jgi:hypothetical protein